jgi:hypothetical protein
VDKLGAIKEQCEEYSWDALRIIVALLKRKYGLCADLEVHTSYTYFETEIILYLMVS